jgi:hypothetical protein
MLRIAKMLISCATDNEKLGLNILTILHMFQVQKIACLKFLAGREFQGLQKSLPAISS